jgi:hypothetical protein
LKHWDKQVHRRGLVWTFHKALMVLIADQEWPATLDTAKAVRSLIELAERSFNPMAEASVKAGNAG